MQAGLMLLVEDSQVFRAILRVYLQDLVAEIIEAEDGVSGLLLLNEREVNLVVSDLSMPRMDGVELLRQIRSSLTARIRTVPVVLLTAERDRLAEAERAGADEVVLKPVRPLALRAAVQRLLVPATSAGGP